MPRSPWRCGRSMPTRTMPRSTVRGSPLTSPTMRCGKSTLLRTIGRLVPRPLPTANITPAAMFRVIEARQADPADR